MFDAISSLVVSMSNQLERLQQIRLSSALANVASKFESMPSLEVSPNLNVPSLIEQIGKNSTEAGTILQSNGSPVAVIFSAEQYKTVYGVINFIPSVVQSMQDALKSRIEYKEKLQQLSVELFDNAGNFFHLLPYSILLGTIATVAGAFLLGKRYHQIENEQTELRRSYLAPVFILGLGIGTLAHAAYRASQISSNFLGNARFLSSFPQ